MLNEKLCSNDKLSCCFLIAYDFFFYYFLNVNYQKLRRLTLRTHESITTASNNTLPNSSNKI